MYCSERNRPNSLAGRDCWMFLYKFASIRRCCWSCAFVAIAITTLLFGCSGNRDRSAAFTPSSQTARESLARALEEWKAGNPVGEIPDTHPLIFVTDQNRKPDQRLVNYQILGETRVGSGRAYGVRLSLTNPPEEVTTEYILVGIEPLWIFRREDFELLMHWDHYMPANASNPVPDKDSTNQEGLRP